MTTKFISRRELVKMHYSLLQMPRLLLRSWGFDPDRPIIQYDDFRRDGYVLEQEESND